MVSELDDLKRMLKAREGKYGSAAAVEMIKARIAALEANPPEEMPLPPSILESRRGS